MWLESLVSSLGLEPKPDTALPVKRHFPAKTLSLEDDELPPAVTS